MMRIVLTLIAGLLLSGCIASGPSFQPEAFVPPNKSVVYAYRPMALVAIGECWRVYVDETQLGCINAGGYFRYELEPGRHTMGKKSAIGGPMHHPLEIETQGGKSYFVKVVVNDMANIPENQALLEIGKTRQQTLKGK